MFILVSIAGDAREKLCLLVDEFKVDVLVLGFKGTGPYKRLFINLCD